MIDTAYYTGIQSNQKPLTGSSKKRSKSIARDVPPNRASVQSIPLVPSNMPFLA